MGNIPRARGDRDRTPPSTRVLTRKNGFLARARGEIHAIVAAPPSRVSADSEKNPARLKSLKSAPRRHPPRLRRDDVSRVRRGRPRVARASSPVDVDRARPRRRRARVVVRRRARRAVSDAIDAIDVDAIDAIDAIDAKRRAREPGAI